MDISWSSRGLETNAAPEVDGGQRGDRYDFAESYNIQRGDIPNRVSLGRDETQDGEEHAPNERLEKTEPEPRTRRYAPDHPAIHQLRQASNASLESLLQRQRDILERLRQTEMIEKSQPSLAGRKHYVNHSGIIQSTKSQMSLYERTLELRRQGRLEEPSAQDSQETSVLYDERTNLFTTLKEELGVKVSRRNRRDRSPAYLRSDIGVLKRLLQRKRDEASVAQSVPGASSLPRGQIAAKASRITDRHGSRGSHRSNSLKASKLESLIDQLRLEFQKSLESVNKPAAEPNRAHSDISAKKIASQRKGARRGDQHAAAGPFADSPADLAELQLGSASEFPGTKTTDEPNHNGPRGESRPELQTKGPGLVQLRRSLETDTGSRDQRSADHKKVADDRVLRIESNIRDYQRLSSANGTARDTDASASLATLHAAVGIAARGDEAALLKKDPSQPTDNTLDLAKNGKPPTPRRRRMRRTSRAVRSGGGVSMRQTGPKTAGQGQSGNGQEPARKAMEHSKQESKQSQSTDCSSKDDLKSREKNCPPLEPSSDSPPSIARLEAADLKIDALDIPQPAVPGLEYGLDRVLFNPGVYQLQDPTSRVYNFDPYLQDIMPAVEFDFNALKEYKTSSEDMTLSTIAEQHQKRYIGSTSSMTSTLAHFHYLLSDRRPLNLDMLSRGFTDQASDFTKINKSPNAIFLRWKPESATYAIDADKEFNGANVLMMLGKSMEKMLTLSTSEFERYRKSDPRGVSEELRNEPEAFQYTTMGDFLMRSQLDAYDSRLPGTGMFDLKTRAVLPVRMDAEDFEPMLGYEIHTLQGRFNSYEREYYDMMRSTMLKYMLQARMGRMQGIFAAYHNIERIFGFQYIPMMDMDRAIHGQIDPCLGDQEFKLSVRLLNEVLNKATTKFPGKSLRLHFETSQQNLGAESLTSVMSIFAEPMEELEIQRIQSLSKEKVREFERKMMGIDERPTSPKSTADIDDINEAEDQPPTEYPPATPEPPAMEPDTKESEPEEDSVPTTYPPATPEPPSSSSSNPDLTSNTSETDSNPDSTPSSQPESSSNLVPLFAATLMVKSLVNDEHVKRPFNIKRDDKWAVEYLLTEYSESESTWARYVAMKARRKEILAKERDEDEDVAPGGNGSGDKKQKKRDASWTEFLRSMARRGREFRKQMDAAEEGREKKFAWVKPGDQSPSTGRASVARAVASEVDVHDAEQYMTWLYGERGRKV